MPFCNTNCSMHFVRVPIRSLVLRGALLMNDRRSEIPGRGESQTNPAGEGFRIGQSLRPPEGKSGAAATAPCLYSALGLFAGIDSQQGIGQAPAGQPGQHRHNSQQGPRRLGADKEKRYNAQSGHHPDNSFDITYIFLHCSVLSNSLSSQFAVQGAGLNCRSQ